MASPLKVFACLALLALFAGAGCGGDNFALSAETDEPLYRDGQQLKNQGRPQEALAAYLKVIAKRGDLAPESHLEAGLIYLNTIEDPIAAIYHFRKYLELEPNSRLATQVRGLIDSAKLKFAGTLPAKPLENEENGLELSEQVSRLQHENDELRAELAGLHPAAAPSGVAAASPRLVFGPPPAPSPAGEPASPIALAPLPAESEGAAPLPQSGTHQGGTSQGDTPQGGEARTHTVAKGDTLSNLAQRFYGTRSRARIRQIVEANRDKLSSESSPLKIGTVLKIP